jgi:repressor of nif and glnA expression
MSRGLAPAHQGTLHEEIREILAERREPMSVAQIAEEIGKRGRYQSPRAGRPISAAMVSRRVSNPNYRRLFRRNGRKITLGPGTSAPKV